MSDSSVKQKTGQQESSESTEQAARDKNYIVLEGPIGVGKTSLAHKLAKSFGSDLVLEDAGSNPFLERYYQTPGQSALPTQLYFLFQRAQQMQDLRQGDMFNPVVVSDFLLAKDRLFAEMTLERDELDLYDKINEKLEIVAPVPDLVVYLQAPADVLKQRVLTRGIQYEKQINLDYLETLVDTYTRFFHDYQDSPLLIVNAAEIDPIHNAEDYEMLKEQILEVQSGRHYFNTEMLGL